MRSWAVVFREVTAKGLISFVLVLAFCSQANGRQVYSYRLIASPFLFIFSIYTVFCVLIRFHSEGL